MSSPDHPTSTSRTATDQPEAPQGPLGADTIHYLLRVTRRRHVVRVIDEADTPLDIGDLTERVASIETGTPVDRLDHRQRKRVYVALHQEHLDRLADEAVIEHDGNGRRIAEGEAFDQLQRAQQEIATIAAEVEPA